MPYKGIKDTFRKDPNHANIRAKINQQLTPGGKISDPEVAILCNHDGTVVIIYADSLPVTAGASNSAQVRYVYEEGPDEGDAKEGAASDPCVYYVAGGRLEKVCW